MNHRTQINGRNEKQLRLNLKKALIGYRKEIRIVALCFSRFSAWFNNIPQQREQRQKSILGIPTNRKS